MVRNLYQAHADGNLAMRLAPPVTPAVWGMAHFFVHGV